VIKYAIIKQQKNRSFTIKGVYMKFTFWASAVCGSLFFILAIAGQVISAFFQAKTLGSIFSFTSMFFLILGIILFSIFLVGLDIIKKIEEKLPEKTEEAITKKR
jgi:hypothetical protein